VGREAPVLHSVPVWRVGKFWSSFAEKETCKPSAIIFSKLYYFWQKLILSK
jgi:hypothetical protein